MQNTSTISYGKRIIAAAVAVVMAFAMAGIFASKAHANETAQVVTQNYTKNYGDKAFWAYAYVKPAKDYNGLVNLEDVKVTVKSSDTTTAKVNTTAAIKCNADGKIAIPVKPVYAGTATFTVTCKYNNGSSQTAKFNVKVNPIVQKPSYKTTLKLSRAKNRTANKTLSMAIKGFKGTRIGSKATVASGVKVTRVTNTAFAKKYIKVSKTGKITVVKHNCKKSTKYHKIKVKITAPASRCYKAYSKTVTVTIKMY